MSRGAEVLSRAAGPALLIGLAALVPLLLPGEGADAGLLRLLMLLLLLPVLVVLALEAPLGRRTALVPRLLLLGVAAAVAILVTARSTGLEVADLAFWSAGPPLVALAGLGAAGLAGGRRFGTLAGLAAPALLVFLPFLADPWIVRTSDPVRLREGLEVILQLAPWPGAAGDLLGVDLFKNEGLYRDFLIGEQLYALPGAGAVLQGQAFFALALLGLAGLLRLLRALSGRILSPKPGCASIAQP